MKKSVFNMGIPFKWMITQDRGIRVKTGNKQRKKNCYKTCSIYELVSLYYIVYE